MGTIPPDLPPVPAPDPAAGRAWSLAVQRLAKWAADRAVIRRERFGGYWLKTVKTDEGEKQVATPTTKPANGPAENALTAALLRQHFQATETGHVLGLHPLTAAAPHTGRWVGFDIDNHAHLAAAEERNARYVAHLHRKLAALGCRPLTATWGGGGYHVLVYFNQDVPGDVLHGFGVWAVADAPEFGYYPAKDGDPMSGLPEHFPKKPTASKAGNAPWLRLVGRHKSRDVWAIVYDGAEWLQGAAAVEHVLNLDGDDPALIPAEGAPTAEVPKAKSKPPRPPKRPATGPVLKVTGDMGDVFVEYNRRVGLDLVVALHEQGGGHEVTSRSATRVEFRRNGKADGGGSFNVAVIDGVPVTYNFSTGAGLPPNDGLSPAEVRCYYETGRTDSAAMSELARKLKAEMGWSVRAEPEQPAGNDSPPPDDSAPPPAASRFTDSGYTVILGGTFHCQLERNKETGELAVREQTKLANFAARITGETVTDDGVDQTREFTVAVEHQRRRPVTVAVPVEKFGGLDWVVERLGVGYVIKAGRGVKDHLRAAVQELSGDDVPTTTTYAHTGWREVGGRWVYLHAGGAVGDPTGLAAVRLDGAAAGFHLPAAPTADELRAAVRASLGILDGLAPEAVTFPLLSAVYRAPLGAADFGLWLTGQTGAQKSELAALAQQHSGPTMIRTRLPGNWSSTDNALEGLAFTLKDAVFVADDFAPPASKADLDRLYRTADRLIRGAGNSAGRQRMRADGTLRPQKPPRGLTITSAEDVPRGHSIAARLSVVTIRRGDVNLTRLSACQAEAREGRYAAALAGYLEWLAPQYGTVLAGLDAERIELRNRFVGAFPHARTPDVVANQLIGLRYLLRFAEDVGAVTAEERAALWGRGQAAFRAVADDQGEHQRDADPVAQFPAALRSIVSSGRGHVAGPDGKEPTAPPSPVAWGYEEIEGRGTFDPRSTFRGRGRKIGWVADGVLMLDPDATYAALADFAREKGQAYPLTQPTLYRRLKEAGLLVRTDGERTVYPANLEGVRRRVVHLPAEAIFPSDDPVSRFSCPGFRDADANPGQENDANSHAKPGFVPPVPVVPVSGTEERTGTPDAEFAAAPRGRRAFTDDDVSGYDAIAH